MQPILSMRHICKSFFGAPANADVGLDIYKGEVHALLGENGAGKTTLMNILYGVYTPDSGEILLNGSGVHFNTPKDAIDHRIGMVHQHFMLVPNLTVSQNVTLGLKSKGHPFTDRKSVNARLKEISERYGLMLDPDALVSSLSVGEQQRVEIIKLLYRDMEILILDEPTAVLTPHEIKDFFSVLEKLRADGKAIIIITHRIPEVMMISDRVTVLRDGKVADTFVKDELTEELLSKSMIGRELHIPQRTACNCLPGRGLKLEHISLRQKKRVCLSDVSLEVRAGEIHGIAGVDGNGQKQLAEAIVGISRVNNGHIYLDGKPLDALSIRARKAMGIGYISDDRHNDGLILNMSLSENMLLRSNTSGFVKSGFISHKSLATVTKGAVERFRIKCGSVNQPIRYLSGGNQQKLILARELDENVRLIIAFQPTRGLDIGATEFIHEMLDDYKKKGCCVLLISADLTEIMTVSDRISVIHGGKIAGTMDNNGNIDMTEIGLMMAGKEKKA